MEKLINDIEGGIAFTNIEKNSLITTIKDNTLLLLSKELERLRNEIVIFAKSYEGHKAIKYINPQKGIDEKGFDCSGFVTFVLSHFGLSKKGIRHANEYFDKYGIFVHNPIPGDLIFFSYNGCIPTHIGIYIGENKYINKNGNKIKIDTIKNVPIISDNKNLLFNSNPIGFKRISLKIDCMTGSRWDQVI